MKTTSTAGDTGSIPWVGGHTRTRTRVPSWLRRQFRGSAGFRDTPHVPLAEFGEWRHIWRPPHPPFIFWEGASLPLKVGRLLDTRPR